MMHLEKQQIPEEIQVVTIGDCEADIFEENWPSQSLNNNRPNRSSSQPYSVLDALTLGDKWERT